MIGALGPSDSIPLGMKPKTAATVWMSLGHISLLAANVGSYFEITATWDTTANNSLRWPWIAQPSWLSSPLWFFFSGSQYQVLPSPGDTCPITIPTLDPWTACLLNVIRIPGVMQVTPGFVVYFILWTCQRSHMLTKMHSTTPTLTFKISMLTRHSTQRPYYPIIHTDNKSGRLRLGKAG